MSWSFQEVTLFTVIGWSDGLTEMFVEATVAPSMFTDCDNNFRWEPSAGSQRCQILDLQQHGVLLRPQLVSDLQATHQV